MSSPTIEPEYTRLYEAIQQIFDKTSLGEDRWYIPAVACLVYHDPMSLSNLYLHLTNQPAYQTPSSRQSLVRRIREALVKSIITLGVCKPIEAIIAISAVERPEDRDLSITREGWQADDQNLARGSDWLSKVYKGNTQSTMDLFAGHRDFEWISKNISYGLFLSDRQVLDDIETQLVVLPSIMSQNLPQETRWHIRGTRRIGVSKDDVQAVVDLGKLIAAHYKVVLDKVPAVDDVENEV
ncbi:hypothetical protein PT974_10883 [Cladobotryum mycophilum]|uniref:DNA polymerase alpha subunit B n=1 Tax=Cladobotryum mycophilum TaxID=491253 RepID=A0ABR0SB22_9HYPO